MGRDSRDAWADRLERCRRSGLTAKEFARREGVSARTLTWWRWKLGREEGRRRARVARPVRRSRKRKVEFVEILGATAMSSSAADTFEIETGRYRVRVPARFEKEALERLLGVLEGR